MRVVGRGGREGCGRRRGGRVGGERRRLCTRGRVTR